MFLSDMCEFVCLSVCPKCLWVTKSIKSCLLFPEYLNLKARASRISNKLENLKFVSYKTLMMRYPDLAWFPE